MDLNYDTITKIIETDTDPNTSYPLNVTSDTCGPHQIQLIFGKDRDYREEDDSDFVKQIKSYGILDETDISFKNGWIFSGGSIGRDCNFNRDFTYRQAYIKKRDNITKTNLQNKQKIYFILSNDLNGHKDVPAFDYDNYHKEWEKEDDSTESSDDFSVLFYKTFIDNNMKMDNLGLMYENEIILKSSYANILFDSPIYRSSVVFTLHANDEIAGFTMKELSLKIMQRYHLIVFLYKNYNMEEGKLVDRTGEMENIPNKELFTNIPKSGKYCFEPVLYESELYDNGVMGLEYCKEKEQWTVLLYDYI
jgi:hypothetical protein